MSHPNRLAAAVAIALIAGAGCAAPPPASEDAMAVSSQTAHALIPLSDEQLFEHDPARLDQIMRRLSDAAFDGLLLRAPAGVPIYEQDTLPVLLASKETVLRAWQVLPGENLVLVATDLDTGAVRVARALVDPKEADANFEEDIRRPPPPNQTAATGTVASAWRLDARARLGLPWQPANLRLAALALDRASNTAAVTLTAPLGQFRTGPIEVSPPAAAGDGLPSYRQRPQSPPPPPAQGANFELLQKGSELLVAGVFVIPARDAHLALSEADARARGVAALVPVTVALLRLDGRLPWLLPLVVPVHGPARAAPGDALRGWFTLEATAQLGHTLPPGHYAAWIMLEGVPIGPRRFQIQAANRAP